MLTWILLVVGGLNWLLKVFNFDLASWGLPDMLMKIVYLLVGLSALYELFTHKKNCKMCSGQTM
jgi:uncharacterized membrane protein YuzA (DUF378 family)